MMHIHKWGNWVDVDYRSETKFTFGCMIPIIREVIVQQRRCSVCNRVKARRA